MPSWRLKIHAPAAFASLEMPHEHAIDLVQDVLEGGITADFRIVIHGQVQLYTRGSKVGRDRPFPIFRLHRTCDGKAIAASPPVMQFPNDFLFIVLDAQHPLAVELRHRRLGRIFHFHLCYSHNNIGSFA